MNTLKIIAKWWGSGLLTFVTVVPIGLAAPLFTDANLLVRGVVLLLLSPILIGWAQCWFWTDKRKGA